MAKVSYAFREDPSSIFLLEDAGLVYENFCQITSFGRNLIRPEFFPEHMFFAEYNNQQGKYRGNINQVQMSLEDNECVPRYNYVVKIDSEIEFSVIPSVIQQLSQNYMPAWNMKSYLDYFSDRKSGIIIFLRVYKINQVLDPSYLEKGCKGSAQILKLYDSGEQEFSIEIDGLSPVVPDNKFEYIKEEIIHLLRVENAFIAQYENSKEGLQCLKERIEVDKLLQGTHQRWEVNHLQWLDDKYDADDVFDMAQLDYNEIYRQVLEISPGMKSIIDYTKSIQAARLGEYDYLLKDIHENNVKAFTSEQRIFDMSIRSAIKNALHYYQKYGLDIEDAFQNACIGIVYAIRKHNDNVEGLFPSYASSWMAQVMGREMPLYQYNFRIPVHYKDYIAQVIKRIEDEIGPICFESLEIDELYRLLLQYGDCDKEQAKLMAEVLCPAISIEDIDDNSYCEYTPFDEVEYELDLRQVDQCLDVLNEREKGVITHRFGFDGVQELSLEDVGKMYGITRERVRQIELKSEWKILTQLKKIKYLSQKEYKFLMDTRFKRFKRK